MGVTSSNPSRCCHATPGITDAVSFTQRASPNTKAFLISWHVVIGKAGKSTLFSLLNEDTTQTDQPPGNV
jgi:hypothetical protein